MNFYRNIEVWFEYFFQRFPFFFLVFYVCVQSEVVRSSVSLMCSVRSCVQAILSSIDVQLKQFFVRIVVFLLKHLFFRFITDLLSILFCSNEKIGIKMRKDVMEMVGTQLSHALVPYLFENMTQQVLKFFDHGGSVS